VQHTAATEAPLEIGLPWPDCCPGQQSRIGAVASQQAAAGTPAKPKPALSNQMTAILWNIIRLKST